MKWPHSAYSSERELYDDRFLVSFSNIDAVLHILDISNSTDKLNESKLSRDA